MKVRKLVYLMVAAVMAFSAYAGAAPSYGAALPSGNPEFPEHIINGVSPNGTTINLFDYWITGQTDKDVTDPDEFFNKGINKNHALLFGSSMGNTSDIPYTYGWWNCWTGKDGGPNTGIVSGQLVDGYPQLNNLGTNGVDTLTGRDGSESLQYLFDPDVTQEGKASYEDVKGLLQVNENGYYTYNSQENYAVYYDENKAFTLYEHPGVMAGGANASMNGQFFPFNAATADYNNVLNKHFMNNVKSNSDTLNHYFGMHMSTRFIQQNGGRVSEDPESDPVTYEFSGDDDVWIFIDGVLVADLGGIHDAASVNINFATGHIKINNTVQQKTLGEILKTGTDTLPDNTYHTLDFFYLERGNTDSNLNLRYNLVTIPESNLIKVDQEGNPVTGAVFDLYWAKQYKENPTSAIPIATGTTDQDGEFVFLKQENGNDIPITIDQLYNQYENEQIGQDDKKNDLILIERSTPAGYRSTGEIGLYFYKNTANSGEVLLLSNSVWDEGAYSMPKVTTTTETQIDLLEDATGTGIQDTINLSGPDAVKDPLMFAVVYQKQEGGKWLPVSGDPINGWKVGDDSSWNSVLAAAQSNPCIFQLSSSGAYQVEVSNLPGDISTYYHMTGEEDRSKYTVAYYYTTADSLEGATDKNTWRIDSDSTTKPLDRVFSMDLYVTDIKNQLYVQKVDDDNAPLAGAEFSLYNARDVEVSGDDVTIIGNDQPYDSLTTSDETTYMEGGGMFPTDGKVLENGEYYLIETSAPGGYKLNDTAVHIVIDDTGVYANAGTKDDEITVLRGVGSVMRSMVQFAADDDVDTTLHDIKAALATDVKYAGGKIEYDDADWEGDAQVKHLQYDNGWGLLDYGLYDATEKGTVDDLTIATDNGWSKLLVRQCYKHNPTVDTSLKTNLENQDITNLFSGTVTVRVANEKTGNLKISKAVTGDSAPAKEEFTFNVTVKKDGETPVSGTYNTKTGNSEEGSITFTKGSGEIKLKKDESLTILGLPEGASYTVEEVDIPAGFTPTATVQESDGTVDGDNSAKVTGTIQHNTTDGDAVELAYTNQYMKAGTLEGATNLAITKILEGREWNDDDSFTFTLTADSSDEATVAAVEDGDVVLPENAAGIEIKNDTEDHTASFGNITVNEAGEYKFVIKEVVPKEGSAGIAYDKNPYEVTVAATENTDEGKLDVTATYEGDSTFTNTYTPESIKVAPQGTKVFEGRDVQNSDTFKFKIKAAEGTPMPAHAEVTVNGNDFKDGSADVSFGEITYNKAGTYKYVITEEKGSILGVTYDKESVLMTVEVTYDKATGEFSREVTYEKGGETSGDGFTFTNTYEAAPTDPVTGFEVRKTVEASEGNAYDIEADDFAFTMTASDDNPEPDPLLGDVTVNNDENGSAVLTNGLVFEAPGTYIYSVSEDDNGRGGITYDKKVYTITVEVTDDGSGKLTADKTITLDGEPVDAITFENGYDPDKAGAVIQGTKRLTGKALEEDMFTFKLSAVDGAPMPETATTHNKAAGVFSFEAIIYDKPGTYKYKVSEVKGDAAGYTYDSKTYDVTVKVTDVEGELTAEISEGLQQIVFSNTYAPVPLDVSGQIGGTKNLTGRDLKEGEFVFQLKDAEGEVVSEAKNKADGSFAFKDVTIDSAGTHNYTISEKNNGLGGVEYDGALYGVTVEATDDNGRIAVEGITYSREGEVVDKVEFANTYKAAGTSVQIGAIKQLEGRDLEEGEFTFVLSDENGNDVSEAVNGADGSVMFDTITYDEPGTYKYEVRELAGDDRHIRYDESVYDVTVTVKDAGGGYLEAAVDSGEGAIVFSNLYDEDEVFAKTGDNTPLAGALALALLALTGAGAVAVRRKLRA